jgi:hypothetical protein
MLSEGGGFGVYDRQCEWKIYLYLKVAMLYIQLLFERLDIL